MERLRARRNLLTNNTDEADIAALISGDSVFSIPYFQRPYKWKTPRHYEHAVPAVSA